ncbi:hypothetical protein GQ54DRAFT_297642 [Martensiomyces pterosporus]|nr:hypothetical protein GQ54DRAFT_297642 [Martensiomyces pterosporus]
MPPSDLISVRSFRDKFAGLVRSQKDHTIFNAQSEWPKEMQEEVASRCKIADDLSFSNAAFVNPTLFHMLRQHREFNEATERELLQKKKQVAMELEKRRREKLAGGMPGADAQSQDQQAEHAEATGVDANANIGSTNVADGEYGDSSTLLAIDADGHGSAELGPPAADVDKNTVEDALARLASGTSSGIGQAENAVNGGGSAVDSNDDSDDSDGEEEAEGNTDNHGRGDGGSETQSLFGDSDVDGWRYKASMRLSATPQRPAARNHEEVTLQTPVSELPRGITQEMLKKAIANSGFARSTDIPKDTKREAKMRARAAEPAGVSELENKFRNVKKLLDESTLASLRKANRRMVPPKYRLEVNFLTNRVQPEPDPNFTPVADDEVILSVCLFNTRSTTAKMEEYLVLGSQSLTVLRDAFYCISDFLVSQRDEQNENTKEKKVSSSYFFIEKTFYNDMRSPSATDYSRVIMEWASDPERQEKNSKLRGLQSRLMDGARFLDLSIRLKQPYIFVHQGDCEHVLMFTDLRLLGPKDDQYVENYPKQVFRTRHMRHKCRMCSAYPAQYVTKNDFHSGMSPCYFCEKCYTPFHYSTDGKRLLEHDCFPYANVNLI